MPRDLEFFFLYQHSGRFPDSQIITQSRLPKYFKTVLSGCSVFSVTAHGFVFPAHSDEIAQVFHLFPFYLLSAPFRAAAAPDASSIVIGDILASSGLLCKDH